MRACARDGTIRVMKLLLEIVLGIHIAAGTVALLVFWVPLVTTKGGNIHRRAGWVYVTAAATVAITGIVGSCRLMTDGNPRHWRAGVFLFYVAVFASESAQLGVRALRAKNRAARSPRTIDLVLPCGLIAGGIALAALGLAQERILYVLFAALGTIQGATHLRFWIAPPSNARQWFLAHLTGMGTSCITTLTAFVVVNAQRFGMRTFDVGLWVTPIAVLGVGLTVLRRYYDRRLASA